MVLQACNVCNSILNLIQIDWFRLKKGYLVMFSKLTYLVFDICYYEKHIINEAMCAGPCFISCL